jgi:hypothetical protein
VVESVNRYFWSILSLAGLAVWLIGSYALPPQGLRIDWGWFAPQVGGWLQLAALVCFCLFVALQLWLLRATFGMRAVFTPPPISRPSASPLQLKFGAELFWTILPLLMTLGLAWLSYQTWISVPTV